MIGNMNVFEAALREIYREMETDEVLSKALEILRANGWGKGALRLNDNRVCSLGALNMACTGSANVSPDHHHRNYWAWQEAVELVNNHAKEQLKLLGFESSVIASAGVGSAAVYYNDAYNTTYEDVSLVFKKALADAEEDGNDGPA